MSTPLWSTALLCALQLQDNPPFSHEVTHAQFYYLDKFLLLACGNSFNLYKYRIDTERPDDVKRCVCMHVCVLYVCIQVHACACVILCVYDIVCVVSTFIINTYML